MSHAECNMTQVECGTVGCPAACAGAAAGVGGFGTAASVGGFAAAACVGGFGAAPKAVAGAGGLVAGCVFAGGLEAGGGGLIDAKAPVVAAFGAVVRPKSGLGSCDASGAKCSGATDGPGVRTGVWVLEIEIVIHIVKELPLKGPTNHTLQRGCQAQ